MTEDTLYFGEVLARRLPTGEVVVQVRWAEPDGKWKTTDLVEAPEQVQHWVNALFLRQELTRGRSERLA